MSPLNANRILKENYIQERWLLGDGERRFRGAEFEAVLFYIGCLEQGASRKNTIRLP